MIADKTSELLRLLSINSCGVFFLFFFVFFVFFEGESKIIEYLLLINNTSIVSSSDDGVSGDYKDNFYILQRHLSVSAARNPACTRVLLKERYIND